MAELVTVQMLKPGLALATLNRPERRNALCIRLLSELCDQVERLAAEPSNRVLIVRGAGPVFCSGLDLSEAAAPELVQQSAECMARALQLMRGTRLVTIAAAHGGAYAGDLGAWHLSIAAPVDRLIATGHKQVAIMPDQGRCPRQITRLPGGHRREIAQIPAGHAIEFLHRARSAHRSRGDIQCTVRPEGQRVGPVQPANERSYVQARAGLVALDRAAAAHGYKQIIGVERWDAAHF